MTADEAIQQVRDARQRVMDEWKTMTPEQIRQQLHESELRIQAMIQQRKPIYQSTPSSAS